MLSREGIGFDCKPLLAIRRSQRCQGDITGCLIQRSQPFCFEPVRRHRVRLVQPFLPSLIFFLRDGIGTQEPFDVTMHCLVPQQAALASEKPSGETANLQLEYCG